MLYLLFLAGGIIAGFFSSALILSKRMKRKKKNRGKQKTEFSKIIIMLVMLTYFVGLIVGVKIVLLDPSQLSALLAYIGGPTATAIAFYCWKAKAENLIKIKKNDSESMIDFNNISGG